MKSTLHKKHLAGATARKFRLCIIGILFFGLSLRCTGNTYIVTSTTDHPVSGGVASATGVITGGAGAGLVTLRSAIIASNANAGADIITLGNGTYLLSITSGGGFENSAATGDLDINGSLTINGNGSGNTIISTNYTSTCGDCKVFGVNQEGSYRGLAVSFNNLTIQNGYNNGAAFSGSYFDTGGGIDFFLTGTGNNYSMTNCVVTNNIVTGGTASYGGGINIDSGVDPVNGGDIPVNTSSRGTVTLTGCTISNNQSLLWGGGINLFADIHNVTLTNCTIQDNTTLGTGGLGANGGGINMRHTYGGTITLTNGSVSNNTGIAYGGGICIGIKQTLNITGTTINGNTVNNNPGFSDFGLGGGIYMGSTQTTATLSNVTISNNHADLGASAGGGGIFGDNGTLTMTGGSITGNTSREGGGVCIEDADLTFTNLMIGSNLTTMNGGGLLIRSTATGTTTLDGITFSSNIADNDNNNSGDGGAIHRAAAAANTLNLNNTITIGGPGTGNSAANGGGIVNTGGTLSKTTGLLTIANNNAKNNGGGLYITGGTINFQKTNIISNTANSDNSGGGEGGGIYNAGGALTLNYNRIALNGANANAASNAFRHVSGTISNIQNNWWGLNSPATVINGTAAFTPNFQLRNTSSAASICVNTSTGITASFVLNSSNTNVLANIDRLIGLPISFTNEVLGSVSGAQTTIQANGTASATFTAGASSGAGSVNSVVDDLPNNDATAKASITINPLPFPIISGPTSVCTGSNATLDAGGGYSIYAWSNSGGSGQTATYNNITTPNTYSVTVTNGSGCTNTDTHSISVNALPTCTITGPPTMPSDTLCMNHQYVYSAPPGMSAYKWIIVGGNGTINGSSTSSSVTVTPTSGGNFTVRDTVTDANGCKSVCSLSRPLNNSPTCTLNGPSSVCAGSTGNVYTVTTTGVTPLWSISGSGTITGASGFSVTVTAGASGSYTVNVTTQFGFNTCTSMCSKTTTIIGSPPPTITGPTAVCSGDNATLDAGSGYSMYAWSHGGGSSQMATFNNITIPTTYTVTVTDGIGCTSTDTHMVGINPCAADLSITKTDGSDSYTPGSAEVYTIVIKNNGPANVVGATVSDILPAILNTVSWTSATSGSSAVTAGAMGAGNSLAATINIGTGADTVTFTVSSTVSMSAMGKLFNTASVATPMGTTDPNLLNNMAIDSSCNSLVYTSVMNGMYDDPATWGGCPPPNPIPQGVEVHMNHNIINDGPLENNGIIMCMFDFINTPTGVITGTGTITCKLVNQGTVRPGN